MARTVRQDVVYLEINIIRFRFGGRGFPSVGQQERGERRMRGKESNLPALVHPRFPWTRIIDLFAVDVCFRYGACSNGTRSSPLVSTRFIIPSFYYSVERDNKEKNHRIYFYSFLFTYLIYSMEYIHIRVVETRLVTIKYRAIHSWIHSIEYRDCEMAKKRISREDF